MIVLNLEQAPPAGPMQILHLEDSAVDHELVVRTLAKADFQCSIVRVETLEDFQQIVAKTTFDVILADYRLPGFTALDAWAALPSNTRPPFILLSGAIGEAAAVAAIHLGISDYLHKDDLGRLGRVILQAIDVHSTRLAKNNANRELAASEKRLAEFAGYLQATIERERAAIAREIHDDIGGSLAAAILDLGWISRHNTNTATQEHSQAATEMLQHAIGASQRIMMNLRPSILDQGLYAAVQWLANSFEKRTGIKTILRTNSEHIQAPQPIQLAAYRTTQEALTNASKYAQCTLVQIDLSDAKGVLTIEVTDNGIGISEAEMQNPQTFGLRGLHERAKTVGGWLDVSTCEGAGTSITLSIPLTDQAPSTAEEPTT
jgi:signal transduction histidine kinase